MKLCSLTSALLVAAALAPAAKAQGSPPVCINGGPYTEECQGAQTVVQLNGTASYDPDGTEVTFFWRDECPKTNIENPTSPTPTIVVNHGPGAAACAYQCSNHAELTVTSGGQKTKCPFVINVVDTTAPALSLPPDLTAVWGIDEDPSNTGFATAVDLCDPNPVITYVDTRVPAQICSGLEEWVERDWTATDACGNSVTGKQVITLLSPAGGCGGGGAANLELDPTNCTNYIDTTNQWGFFTADLMSKNAFQVKDVDLSTVRLIRTDVATLNVHALRPNKAPIGDWMTAQSYTPSQCSWYGQDGEQDVTLTFRRKSVIKHLGLDLLPSGTVVPVAVTGYKVDGTAFWAADELVIQ